MEPVPVTIGKRLIALACALGYLALSLLFIFSETESNNMPSFDTWESKGRAYFAYFRGNPQPLIDMRAYEASTRPRNPAVNAPLKTNSDFTLSV